MAAGPASGSRAICYLLITAYPSRHAFAPGSIAGPMSITLDQVTKRYQGVPVVNDVSVEIGEGEFFVLLGPSGSGKSTLLRAIAGLTGVDHGRKKRYRHQRSR